ncbi:MAG: hypothetical protein QNK23_02645 [Crocinitomicaceae bacterium]|nr:hypothetical protein [Crocinitomicaceae bacterium]
MKIVYLTFIAAMLAACTTAELEPEPEENQVDQLLDMMDNMREAETTTPSEELDDESSNPEALLRLMEVGEVEFDFYAEFTEPFWTLYFLGDELIFNNGDGHVGSYSLDKPFDPSADYQTLHYSIGITKWRIFIEKAEPMAYGISDIVFPYHAIINGEYEGGGAQELCYSPDYSDDGP